MYNKIVSKKDSRMLSKNEKNVNSFLEFLLDYSKKVYEKEFQPQKILKRKVSVSTRLKVFSRDNFKCRYCGDSPSINEKCQLVIDHILPLSRGGSNLIKNLQTLCRKCNSKKSTTRPLPSA